MNRAKNNNNNNYCSFCISIGVKGPFNHCLKLGDNITCPLLLNTTCGICGVKGHTSNFCKKPKVKSRWAGLEIEENTTSDSDNESIQNNYIIKKKDSIEEKKWISPVPIDNYKKRWADLVEQNDRDELPPLPKSWK